MNRLLPRDRAYKLFCMNPDLQTSRRSAIPAIEAMTNKQLQAVHDLNVQRARHIGIEPAHMAPHKPGIREQETWASRFKQPGHGAESLYLRATSTTARPDSKCLVFVDGYLLGAGKPPSILLIKIRSGLTAGTVLTVVGPGGVLPHATDGDFWLNTLPEGGKPLDLVRKIRAGRFLTKKGSMIAPVMAENGFKARLGQLFERVDDRLHRAFGYNLFATHGTLLGLVRNGDLIENDDDFDCAYLSRFETCAAVSEERLAIIEALTAAGFNSYLGKTGHIKVRDRDLWLDLMPAWFDQESFNVSSYSSLPMGPESLLPLGTVEFHGHRLKIPHVPETFLSLNYGPGWRVPDPAYRSVPSRKCRSHRKLFVEHQRTDPALAAYLEPGPATTASDPDADDTTETDMASTPKVAAASEARRIRASLEIEPRIAAMTAAIESGAAIDHRELVALADEALTLRRLDDAVRLWRAHLARGVEIADDHRCRAALAFSQAGGHLEAERALAGVSAPYRKGSEFVRVRDRVAQRRRDSLAIEIEPEIIMARREGRRIATRSLVATMLTIRGFEESALAAAHRVVDALGDPAAGRSGEADDPLPPPTPMQDIFVAGFGWSGSGAIFDFLRQSREVSLPFRAYEASVFGGMAGRPYGFGPLYQRFSDFSGSKLRAYLDHLVLETMFGIGARLPLGDKGDSASRRSLAYHARASAETRKVFADELVRAIEALRASPDLTLTQVEAQFRRFFRRLLAALAEPDRPRRLYSNVIHAYNCACLRLVDEGVMLAVQRDPRDMFASRVIEGRTKKIKEPSAASFIKSWRDLRARFETSLDKFEVRDRVHLFDFEDFVRNQDCRDRVLALLGIDPAGLSLHTRFHESESVQNIGLYRSFEDQDAIKQIEDALL